GRVPGAVRLIRGPGPDQPVDEGHEPGRDRDRTRLGRERRCDEEVAPAVGQLAADEPRMAIPEPEQDRVPAGGARTLQAVRLEDARLRERADKFVAQVLRDESRLATRPGGGEAPRYAGLHEPPVERGELERRLRREHDRGPPGPDR